MIQPKTSISIDGEFLAVYESIRLVQQINTHHEFEIIVDYDTIETLGGHTLDKSKVWLGKSIVINFSSTEFLGVITNVQINHDNGFHGKIVLSGYSKTIVLESGKHMQSWLEKDLTSIVKDTIGDAAIEIELQPSYTTPIEYQSQYLESHFGFLQRLAKQYNEWLYYDGVKLVFGKPTLTEPIAVEYGKDVDSIQISIQAKAHGNELFSYNALEDRSNASQSKDIVSGLNELGNHAFDVSKNVFNVSTQSFTNTQVQDKSDIDKVLQRKQASDTADVHMLKSESTKQGLTIGSIIKVSSARYENGSFEVKNYGEYIIIEITHEATGNDEYVNHFKAISAGVTILPEPEVKYPEAQPQIATVISNADPKQKGRIQVQFQWQQNGNSSSSWLRVMTPDAGRGHQHDTNRGHVFIPEVGDQVMIGFRYNDPNRPFVMGSLFNGTTGSGGQDQNNYKSIVTRSGHTIEFNDTNRNESITIKDKSNNIIHIDTANSSIQISAPENISIASKNIDITAGDYLTISAGKNIGINAGDDITIGAGDDTIITSGEDLSLTAKNISEQASENFESLAFNLDEKADVISKTSLKSDMELNSSGNIKSSTGDKTNLF